MKTTTQPVRKKIQFVGAPCSAPAWNYFSELFKTSNLKVLTVPSNQVNTQEQWVHSFWLLALSFSLPVFSGIGSRSTLFFDQTVCYFRVMSWAVVLQISKENGVSLMEATFDRENLFVFLAIFSHWSARNCTSITANVRTYEKVKTPAIVVYWADLWHFVVPVITGKQDKWRDSGVKFPLLLFFYHYYYFYIFFSPTGFVTILAKKIEEETCAW